MRAPPGSRDSDWANLPEELLDGIFARLKKQQRKHFRQTCKAWSKLMPRPVSLSRQRDLTIAEAEVLARLSSLTMLALGNARSIHAVTLVTQIQALSIQGADPISLQPLQRLPHLASLRLEDLSYYDNDADLRDLLPLTSVTELQLQNMILYRVDPVGRMFQLQSLSFLEVQVADFHLELHELRGLTNLRK